jgi:hypothetical protein
MIAEQPVSGNHEPFSSPSSAGMHVGDDANYYLEKQALIIKTCWSTSVGGLSPEIRYSISVEPFGPLDGWCSLA